MTNKRQLSGFTLLEVIVVLMISGLVAVVLIQGLALFLDARLRIADAIDNLERQGLQESIVTTPLEGVMPDYPDGPDVFFGDQRRMRGLTISPLQGTRGAPTGFGMFLQYDVTSNATTLTYFERGYDPMEIARWDGDFGAFTYRGREGDWSDVWSNREDRNKQVPRTIQMMTGLQDTAYVVSVKAPHDRFGRAQDGPFGDVQ